jgi:hypothetical protein
VAEEELDLLEIPAVLAAELGSGAAEVMGALFTIVYPSSVRRR